MDLSDEFLLSTTLLGVSGRWRACGSDEEMDPMRGMYGTLIAGFEVQRTIKSAQLTVFFRLLRRIIGSTTAHEVTTVQ